MGRLQAWVQGLWLELLLVELQQALNPRLLAWALVLQQAR
jgi:hypothetical protein